LHKVFLVLDIGVGVSICLGISIVRLINTTHPVYESPDDELQIRSSDIEVVEVRRHLLDNIFAFVHHDSMLVCCVLRAEKVALYFKTAEHANQTIVDNIYRVCAWTRISPVVRQSYGTLNLRICQSVIPMAAFKAGDEQ
tara:strand:- start:2194 stop:2610 length:417 start_codon:yes stop_codon:yes gene_type:complete